jgi:uncharacterized protein YndB with AHSA1/START domain
MTFDTKLDLVLEKILPITAEQVWQGYTNPKMLMQWFCPRPWKVVACEIDLQPGGAFHTTMQSPEGEKFPNIGTFLQLEKNKKLVWTNAMLPGFRPVVIEKSEIGFTFTAIIELSPHPAGSKYRATVKHKDAEDQKKHAAMGFEQGWSIALDQLVELFKQQKTL